MTWSVVPSEYWRERGGNFTTVPQVFREHGYLTLGIGKTFHAGAASGNSDSKYSWSPEGLPYDGSGAKCPYAPSDNEGDPPAAEAHGPAMSPRETNPDTQLNDCADRMLRRIAEARRGGSDSRPFFLSVGFHKPRARRRIERACSQPAHLGD